MAINIKKSHRGLLHKDLGVKKGEKIPASKLAIKKTDSPAVKKRKTFALNARKWSHEDGGYIPIAELGYAEKPKPWNPDAITEANYAQRDNTQGVIMLNQDMYGKGNNIVSDIPPGQTPLANNIDPNSQDSNMYKQQAANYDQSQVQPIQQKSQGKGNPLSGKGFALGDVIGGALGVLNKLIPAQQGYDQRPTIETNYNAYSQGTGSGAIYDNGGYLTPLQYNKDLRRESKDYDDGGNVQTYALPKGFQIPEGAKVMKYQNDYDAQGNIIGKSPVFQNYSYQDTTQALKQAGVNKMDYAASQQNFAPNTNSNQWTNNHTQNNQSTQNYAQLTPIGNRDVYQDSRINFSVPQIGTNIAMNSKKKSKVNTNSDFSSTALPNLFKDGGQMNTIIDSKLPLDILQGGYIKQLSDNPYDGGTYESVGRSHENGGMLTDTNGDGKPEVNIEGGETLHMSPIDDSAVVGGNMQVPGSTMKFKSAFKQLAQHENKASKIGSKGAKIALDTDPSDSYSALSFNTGKVLTDAANQQQKAIAEQKETLTNMQNTLLELAKQKGVEPQKLADAMKNGGSIPIAKDGYNNRRSKFSDEETASVYDPNDLDAVINTTALQYGVDPHIVSRLFDTENPSRIANNPSDRGAQGVAQFMPGTAKKYGVDKILTSEDPNDKAKVIEAGIRHFSDLLHENDNDYKLALLAYNGGQGAVQKLRKAIGDPHANGEQVVSYLQKKREANPTKTPANRHAYYNESLDYINAITGDDEVQRKKFSNEYYSQKFNTNFTPNPNEIPDLEKQYPHGPLQPFDPTKTGVVQPPDQPKENISLTGILPPNRQQKQQLPSLADRNKLGIKDFLSEIGYLTDKPDYVQGQHYNPTLYQPYQVSFQDKLNENQASFSALQRQIGNNPAALASLAAQKYSSDAGVLGEQFRVNQGINNDVTNKNVGILNQAALTNLQLNDTQADRQSRAKAITDSHKYQALASIKNKFGQNAAENNQIRLYENLFNYRPDQNLKMINQNPDAQFNTTGSPLGGIQQDGRVATTYNPDGSVKQTKVTKDDYLKQQAEMYDLIEKRNNSMLKKWGGYIPKSNKKS